jgi:hypothetical protein
MTTFSRLIGRTPGETTWEPNSVICIEGWENEGIVVPFRRSQEIYLFSKASRPVLGLTILLVNLPGLLFLADKPAGA